MSRFIQPFAIVCRTGPHMITNIVDDNELLTPDVRVIFGKPDAAVPLAGFRSER